MKRLSLFLGMFILTNCLLSELFAQDRAANSFSVLNFGAIADETTDNTAAFQKAIDAASVDGGMVSVPAGNFLIKGSLLLHGVSLKGENIAPRSWEPLNGTIILATGGRDNEKAPALFEMRNSSAISGITVYYPEQTVDDIHPYPWTFHIGGNSPDSTVFDCTVENVTLINSYNGIHAGPYENGRHRINSVFGCVLRRGIFVESVGDIGRIENVQFHCHFWGSKVTNGDFWKVFKYMQANCEAFILGRSDWEYMTNTFVFPAKIGYHFIYTENGNWSGSCNGQFSGIAADATESSIVVEAIQSQGLLITNGQFNSHLAGRSTQIIVEKGCEGSVRFTNCGFWGPVKQNVQVLGNSNVSFQNCYFSSNNVSKDKTNPSWSIIAEDGKLQVQDCTFDGTQTDEVKQWTYGGEKRRPESIWLKPGVKHAIITGNNGYNGISVRNEIGAKAIIRDNEDPVKEKTK